MNTYKYSLTIVVTRVTLVWVWVGYMKNFHPTVWVMRIISRFCLVLLPFLLGAPLIHFNIQMREFPCPSQGQLRNLFTTCGRISCFLPNINHICPLKNGNTNLWIVLHLSPRSDGVYQDLLKSQRPQTFL